MTPREIRDRIYRELLCPPDGIKLHHDVDRCFREQNRMKLEGEVDNIDIGWEDASPSEASAFSPLPTAILYVNREIAAEASKVLYRSNRFKFDISAGSALKSLRTLSLKTRLLINDIAFDVGSTAADNRDNERFWEPSSDYIGDHMHVTEVTIRTLHDMNHEIVESKESKGTFGQEWYLWPAVDQLAMLLIGGKI